MQPKSIPAVKVPATTPLQQPRPFEVSFRGSRVRPGAAATDYPAAAQPLRWHTPSGTSLSESFIRISFGRFFLTLSSLFSLLDPFMYSGRDAVHLLSSGRAFLRRFNRFGLNQSAVFALQRYQQKIYRVAVSGPSRIATPEDVPA